MEGDVLLSIDGKSIGAMRFSEVSTLLSGVEGAPISLEFERVVREGRESRARSYEVALRRERFYLPQADDDDALSEGSEPSESGGRVGRKADYWDGYRAAMAQKAPSFAKDIASFDSDSDDAISSIASLPSLPASPSGSDSNHADDVEPTTEQRLTGALAAGATVGLPSATLPQVSGLADLAENEARSAPGPTDLTVTPPPLRVLSPLFSFLLSPIHSPWPPPL